MCTPKAGNPETRRYGEGLLHRVQGLDWAFGMYGFRFRGLGFRVLGFRGLGFWVLGLGV